VLAALMVILFLGGWNLPFVPAELTAPVAPLIFVVKTYLMIFLFMVVKGSFSRFRVDQMAALSFKVLVPFALIWTLVFGVGYKVFLMTVRGGA
jgi:NADH-quinone oxidoreductase subunit H